MIRIAAILFCLTLTALFPATKATAQVTIESIEVGTSVDDRTLTGAGDMFSNDVNTLYCFTKVSGAEHTPVLKHIWYHGDEEKASVNLTIRTPSFRTWSSKKIWHTWTGEWRVDIVDTSGTVLASKSFTISE